MSKLFHRIKNTVFEQQVDREWQEIRERFNYFCEANGLDENEIRYYLRKTLIDANKGKKDAKNRVLNFAMTSKLLESENFSKNKEENKKMIEHRANVEYRVQFYVGTDQYREIYDQIESKNLSRKKIRRKDFDKDDQLIIDKLIKEDAIRKTLFGNLVGVSRYQAIKLKHSSRGR